VSGVEVRFSDDFNVLHLREWKTTACDIRFKQANRVKFRLNIADVCGILIGPKSFTFEKFFKSKPELKNDVDFWKYISLVTEESYTIDLIFSDRALTLDFLVVVYSKMRKDFTRITNKSLLIIITFRNKLNLIAKN